MSLFKPSHVFANLPDTASEMNKMNAFANDENKITEAKIDNRVIQVSSVGVVTLPPDRCRLTIRVTSTKENVADVKESTTRRLDYIIQTLHNHSVKDSDIQISKSMRRSDSMYQMDVEVTALFIDLHKCQNVSNLLVEKLDPTVTVCLPEFFHSSVTLQNLRHQASLLAIHNAKQKAQEMARFVNQSVGRPISIKEQENKEWQGTEESAEEFLTPRTLQQKLNDASVTVSSKISITFELKPKVKKSGPDDVKS